MGNLAAQFSRLIILLLARPDTATPEGRAQARHRQIALTSLSSVLAKIISLLTALVSVPLTLAYLGSERYGIWLTLSAFPSMFAFVDLGIGSGLMNAVSNAHGRNDQAEVKAAISSALISLILLALVLSMLSMILSVVVPWKNILHLNSTLASAEIGPAVAVFLLTFSWALPIEVVERAQIGLQMGFSAMNWRCVGSIASLVAVLAAIGSRASLPWLVFAFSGVPLIATLLNGLVFFGLTHKQLRPARGALDPTVLRSIHGAGAMFFITQAVAGATKYSDNFIIAKYLGAASVPTYAVPEKLFAQVSGIALMMLSPYWPAYREALSRGDLRWVGRTFARTLTLTVLLSTLASMSLVAACPLLVMVWTHGKLKPSMSLLMGLAVWKIVECTSFALMTFLNGLGKIRVQAISGLITAAFSLSLEIYLVQVMGVPGAVWGTAVAFALFTVIPWLMQSRRELTSLSTRTA